MSKLFLYYLLFLFVTVNACNSKNKTKKIQTVTNKNNKDTVQLCNLILQDLQQKLNLKDSLQYGLKAEQFVDALDSLEYNKIINSNTAIDYFIKGLNQLDSAMVYFPYNFKLINCKKRTLQFLLYFYYEKSDNEMVINTFNQITNNGIEKYLTPLQKLDSYKKFGIAYHQTGDLQKTEEIYRKTLGMAEQIADNNEIAQATVNLNILFQNNNEQDSVILYSNRIINKNIEPKFYSSLALNLANAYFKKEDIQNTINYNEKGIITLSQIDSTKRPNDYEKRIGNLYANKAQIDAYKNNFASADLYFEKALISYKNYYENNGRYLAKLLLQIGNYKILNTQSKLKETPIQYYNLALKALQPSINLQDSLLTPEASKLTAENTYFEILDAKSNYLCNIAKQKNDINLMQKIIEYYTLSFEVEKKLLQNFVYDNSKIEFLNESRIRTEKAIELCYTLFNATLNKEWMNKAFIFIENNKAIILYEKLKQNFVLNNLIKEDSTIEKYKSLKRRIENFEELQNKNNATQTLTTKDATIENDKLEFDAIETKLKLKYPQLNNLIDFNNNYTITKLQSEILNSNTGCINYFYNDSIVYSITLTNNNQKFNKAILLKKEVNQYKENCENISVQINNPKLFLTTSYNMYNKLFPNSFFKEVVEKIIIIPDAALYNINFDAMVQTSNINFSYKNQDFLINKYSFIYGYSIASLLQRKSIKNNFTKNIAFAPVAISAKQQKEILSSTKGEVEAIKKEFAETNVYIDNAATIKEFLNSYKECNIIHIASHSAADTINGNSNIDFYDTTMSSAQFYNNENFKANLFFLSACETTVGKQTKSEGILSLARSVYYAGALNVISSLWKINDESTTTIVKSFYQNIKKDSYATALQKSKLNYLKNCSPEKAAPFYWASFELIGLESTNSSTKQNLYYYLLLIPIFFVAIYFYKRKSS